MNVNGLAQNAFKTNNIQVQLYLQRLKLQSQCFLALLGTSVLASPGTARTKIRSRVSTRQALKIVRIGFSTVINIEIISRKQPCGKVIGIYFRDPWYLMYIFHCSISWVDTKYASLVAHQLCFKKNNLFRTKNQQLWKQTFLRLNPHGSSSVTSYTNMV